MAEKRKKSHTFPRLFRPKMSASCSPYNSDSSGDSPSLHRRDDQGASGFDEIDGFRPFARQKKWTLHNPKNVQHLLTLLQQPGTQEQLVPVRDEDGPLHSIVQHPRPTKEKMELLITLLRCTSVDINSLGKGGMTPLHYAVQTKDVASVRVLLAFGADVNLVNERRHTALDLATFLWVTYERGAKINRTTNKLETICENQRSFPDVTSSPVPSPLLQRSNPKLISRSDSQSSWTLVDRLSSSNGEDWTDSVDQCRINSDDSREFTSSVIIKFDDLVDEVPDARQHSPLIGRSSPLECIKDILDLLYSVHAQSGKAVMQKFNQVVPLLSSFSESKEFQDSIDAAVSPFSDSQELGDSIKIKDFIDGRMLFSLYEELEYNINSRLESQSSLSVNPDEAFALAMQQRELYQFRKTGGKNLGIGFEVEGGSRLLFLDGGGIKGLVQIEVMRQLEESTGRKITQLFDWIIGSSIGGILALGLVYAKKSLKELQQICFKLKEEVFSNPKAGVIFDTKAMEKMIKDEFGEEMIMSDIKKPKVLIAAVNKKQAPLQLHFFNNCFNDEFSKTLVWKVARYTTAAPIFFSEFEDYVDGGVLANNPCEHGLTKIQDFHREKQVNLPIALVVSIGTGIYPPEELGRIDAQEFLFFGKHWFKLSDIKNRALNLIALLSSALVEAEIVAKNCSVRFKEQNIPYYRFSPQLNHVVPAGETDNDKLVDMMLQARIQTPQQGLEELITLFHLVAIASKKSKYRRTRILANE